MAGSYDLIIRGGILVNQDGEARRDVGVTAGRIAAIGDLAAASAGEVIDATGRHVLPGVIDTQVHFREPGLTHKEDLETGSRSAVLGGVTAVFEMPNTNPLTTSAETLADKIARGHHRMYCDFAFYVGGTRENTKELPELERLPGCAGIKVFMGSGAAETDRKEGIEDNNTCRTAAWKMGAGPRHRLSGAGLKPPQAAAVKTRGRERWRKSSGHDPEQVCVRETSESELADDASLRSKRHQNQRRESPLGQVCRVPD